MLVHFKKDFNVGFRFAPAAPSQKAEGVGLCAVQLACGVQQRSIWREVHSSVQRLRLPPDQGRCDELPSLNDKVDNIRSSGGLMYPHLHNQLRKVHSSQFATPG